MINLTSQTYAATKSNFRSQTIYGIKFSTRDGKNYHGDKEHVTRVITSTMKKFPGVLPESFYIDEIRFENEEVIVAWSNLRSFMLLYHGLNKELYLHTGREVARHYLEGHHVDWLCHLPTEASAHA